MRPESWPANSGQPNALAIGATLMGSITASKSPAMSRCRCCSADEGVDAQRAVEERQARRLQQPEVAILHGEVQARAGAGDAPALRVLP